MGYGIIRTLYDPDIPEEVKDLIRELILHCPFREAQSIDWDRLPVQLREDAEGWHFTCQVCAPTTCSGYIKKSGTPSESTR